MRTSLIGVVVIWYSGFSYSRGMRPLPGDPHIGMENKMPEKHEDHHGTARKLDAKPGTHADAAGPVKTETNTCNSGRVSGFVAGAEAHGHFHFHQTRGRGGNHRTRQGQRVLSIGFLGS